MKRWPIRVFAALLAAATLALVIEWRRSYRTTGEFTAGWHRDVSSRPTDQTTAVSLLSRGGRIDFHVIRIPPPMVRMILEGYHPVGSSGLFLLAERHSEPTPVAGSPWFKFEEVHQPIPNARAGVTMDVWSLRFPHWLASLATATASTLMLLPTWRRFTRRRRGLCVRCGYDLRSSTDRCPECGQALERPAALPVPSSP